MPALAALAVVVVLAAAVPALAQDADIRPPVPRKADDPPFFWNLLAVIVIVAAVFGANMIPSKRGHQD